MARAIIPDDDIDSCGLTYDELQELWLGPSHNGSLFSSLEDLRDAWIRGRDVVLRLFANNGRRPMAWWQFDAPALGLKLPGRDRGQGYLYEHGVLDEVEKLELERGWWREFKQAQTPGFMLSTGKEILRGDRARAAHYEWADIPHALIEAWQMERHTRRRGNAQKHAPP